MLKLNRRLYACYSNLAFLTHAPDGAGDSRSIGTLELELVAALNPGDVVPLDPDFAHGISAEAQDAVLELPDFAGQSVTVAEPDDISFVPRQRRVAGSQCERHHHQY